MGTGQPSAHNPRRGEKREKGRGGGRCHPTIRTFGLPVRPAVVHLVVPNRLGEPVPFSCYRFTREPKKHIPCKATHISGGGSA